ncbi:hypothetical protein AOLI_G00093730 [Acnodon oligacanthus]
MNPAGTGLGWSGQCHVRSPSVACGSQQPATAAVESVDSPVILPQERARNSTPLATSEKEKSGEPRFHYHEERHNGRFWIKDVPVTLKSRVGLHFMLVQKSSSHSSSENLYR